MSVECDRCGGPMTVRHDPPNWSFKCESCRCWASDRQSVPHEVVVTGGLDGKSAAMERRRFLMGRKRGAV